MRPNHYPLPALLSFVLLLAAIPVFAQDNTRIVSDRCGTMQTLELRWKAHPKEKQQFEAERAKFNESLRQANNRMQSVNGNAGTRSPLIVPVVFHIVLTNPALVTDAQIQAQLDTLNRDFAGANGDSVLIPSYFKPLYGKSVIQFCMAKQTPNGEPTNGIDRVTTAQTSFSNTNDGVKYSSLGGVDAWDPTSYFNVWVCVLGNGILGYATFPGSGAAASQGVAMDYRSLPAGSYTFYNGGKTLTHEAGHYFNLYHIWGDDNGACTGTDFVDDTPNQANSSSTCSTGIKTDACTPGGNGIMYQNYMDYTADNCLVLFTTQQVARMEAAYNTYRNSFQNSLGCQTPVLLNLDAQLRTINQPGQRICNTPFSPVVTVRNRGSQTLTSLTITSVVDNNATYVYNWTGTLASLSSTDITVSSITAAAGTHSLKIYVSKPNNGTDQNNGNDTLTTSFLFSTPVTSLKEGFENLPFPPAGWDIVNPDGGITWQRANVGKTGAYSAMINNLDYTAVGQQDYLRLPDAVISGVDSAFLSFDVAAATYTDISTANNVWDTLEVLISTDCGASYTSLYKKWGSSLVTRTAPLTTAYIPASSEWRRDSVNLGAYIATSGKILLAFRNTTGFENNIYLDNINLRTVTISPFLKKAGFLVTPSPTNGQVIVQFYPQPTDIKGIAIFNMAGQKVAEAVGMGQSNYYSFDISHASAGIYTVRVVKGNNTLIKKIVKL